MNLSTFEHMKHLKASNMVVADEAVLRMLQSVLLMMLDDIVGYCERMGINYELGGGSALGAIRHGGFIPWDDDVDLNMPRADYNRFIEGFRTEFAEKYTIECPEFTPEVGIPSTRIRLNGTVMRMHDDAPEKAEQGIFIDIFPIENTYNNSALRKLHGLAAMGVGLLLSCRRYFRDRKRYLALSASDTSYRHVVMTKVTIGALCTPLSVSDWSRLVLHVHTLCPNTKSEYVVVPSGRGHFWGEVYRRVDLVATSTARFEGRNVQIPRNWHLYLNRLYGDWHTLPEDDAREHHSYLALSFGGYAASDEAECHGEH